MPDLVLYHGSSSVCSSKVRVGLAEKQLDWTGHHVDLKTGGQNDPSYLKLNPNGVVPTLVHGELVIVESSVILEYIDDLSPENRLMPAMEPLRTMARMWLTRCIDIHAAINSMTFSTVQRARILEKNTPEEVEAGISRLANPALASKRREVLRDGLDSTHVEAAFFILRRMFDDMQESLERHPWLLGDDYSIADTAVLSYVDRLERLGFEGMWQQRTPRIAAWLAASRQRPSYSALDDFIDDGEAAAMKKEGGALWPEVNARWRAFLG